MNLTRIQGSTTPQIPAWSFLLALSYSRNEVCCGSTENISLNSILTLQINCWHYFTFKYLRNDAGILPVTYHTYLFILSVVFVVLFHLHNIFEPTTGVTFFNSGFKSDLTELFPSTVQVIAN
jgi:hypothetical protein